MGVGGLEGFFGGMRRLCKELEEWRLEMLQARDEVTVVVAAVP